MMFPPGAKVNPSRGVLHVSVDELMEHSWQLGEQRATGAVVELRELAVRAVAVFPLVKMQLPLKMA